MSCFGLFITLNSTILNPNFAVKEIQNLDVTEIAREYIKEQLSGEAIYYSSAIDNTLIQEKPWIDQQIKQIIFNSYDYFLGATDRLLFVFPLEEIKPILINNVMDSILLSPPPEYRNLSVQEKEQYLAELKSQLQVRIPSSYELDIDQSLIGQDNMQALEQIKQGIVYFRISFWILISSILVIIGLSALIQKQAKGFSRMMGISFLAAGAVCGTIYFIVKLAIPLNIQSELTVQISTWLPVFIGDLLSPLGIFSLIVFTVGGICLAVSFLIHSHPRITRESNQDLP